MVAAVVKGMLKTRVKLGNISRILLNLIERLIKLLYPPNVHLVNIYILSLVHQLRLLLALTFVLLSYLFS